MTPLRLMVLVSVAFALFGCSSPDHDFRDQVKQQVEALLAQAERPPEAFDEVVNVLSQALRKKPNSISLLTTRANYYAALGHYKKALHDLQHAARLGDIAPEVRMGQCMLLERLHGFQGKAQACYNHVLSVYKKRDSDAAYPGANHVVAALMAKSPNATALKKAFLSKSDRADRFKGLLRGFERRTFLHEVLP